MAALNPAMAALAAFVLLVTGLFPAHAGDVPMSRIDSGQITTIQSMPNVSCTCRYGGRDFSIGDVVCIRGRAATCDRVLNNTSWSFSTDACPAVSQLDRTMTVLASMRALSD